MRQKKEERELEQQILGLADLLIENLIATSMLTGGSREQQLEVSIEIVAKIANLLEQYLGDFNEHFETLLQQLAQQKLPDENVLASFGDFQSLLNTAINKGLTIYQKQLKSPENLNISKDFDTDEDQLNFEATNNNEHNEMILKEEYPKEVETHILVSEKSLSNFEIEEEKGDTDFSNGFDNEEEKHQHILDQTETEEVTVLDKINDDPADAISTADDKDVYDVETKSLNIQKLWDSALKQVFPNVEIIDNHTIKKNIFSYYLPELNLVIDKFVPEKKEVIWKEFYCRQNNLIYLKLDSSEHNSFRQLVRSLKRNYAEKKEYKFSKII